MSRFQHVIAASALLFAALPAQADKLPERAVIVEICIAEESPERVETVLTIPVEKLLRGLPGVKTMNSVTGHGGARFEVRFEGEAGEDDAAAVAQALEHSEAGRGAAPLSRSVQIGRPLPEGQAFGHMVCGRGQRR